MPILDVHRSFEETKPTIFLHFLNPETYRGLGRKLDERQAILAIKILLLTTHEKLYCNLSYVWENYQPSSELSKFLLHAIKLGLVDTVGSYIAPDQFLASVQEKFSYDANRYDAIFRYIPDELVNLGPKLTKNRSTTSFILRSFSNIRYQIDEPPWSFFEKSDKDLISQHSEDIKPIIDEMTSRNAITLSLFQDQANSRLLENALARFSTFCHVYNYIEEFEAEIPVGFQPLTYFDSLGNQKHLINLQVLEEVLFKLGYAPFFHKLGDFTFLRQFSDYRGGHEHQRLVANLRFFLTLTCIVYPATPNRRFKGDTQSVYNFRPRHFLKDVQRQFNIASLNDQLAATVGELVSANFRLKNANPEHDHIYHLLERQMGITPRILIIVATDVEAESFIELFKELLGYTFSRMHSPDHTIHLLGELGGAEVYMVQCEMGIEGPGGAMLTTIDVIDFLNPTAVFCAGIAFGLQRHKQELGDILVSRLLHGYDLRKVNEKLGRQEIISRGSTVDSTVRVLDRFRSGSKDWHGAKIHFGLIMSGSTLSNSEVFVESLLDLEPEAIGAEMEGYGLYSAAVKRKKDWIVVKSICDWGMNKTDEYQKLAATNVAKFISHTIRQGGFSTTGTHIL